MFYEFFLSLVPSCQGYNAQAFFLQTWADRIADFVSSVTIILDCDFGPEAVQVSAPQIPLPLLRAPWAHSPAANEPCCGEALLDEATFVAGWCTCRLRPRVVVFLACQVCAPDLPALALR